MVVNHDMAGQSRGVRQNDVITQHAVVADVRIRHQEIMIADPCDSTSAFGPTVNVDVFTKNVVRPDRQMGFFIVELEILRRNANHAEWEKSVVAANDRGPFENDMGIENTTIAEGDAFADAAEGPDSDGLADAGKRVNDGRGMNQLALRKLQTRIRASVPS